jgi:hypothetical protein
MGIYFFSCLLSALACYKGKCVTLLLFAGSILLFPVPAQYSDYCVHFTVVRVCILILPLFAFSTFIELENKNTQLDRARHTFETNGVVNTGRILTHVVGLRCTSRSQRLS